MAITALGSSPCSLAKGNRPLLRLLPPTSPSQRTVNDITSACSPCRQGAWPHTAARPPRSRRPGVRGGRWVGGPFPTQTLVLFTWPPEGAAVTRSLLSLKPAGAREARQLPKRSQCRRPDRTDRRGAHSRPRPLRAGAGRWRAGPAGSWASSGRRPAPPAPSSGRGGRRSSRGSRSLPGCARRSRKQSGAEWERCRGDSPQRTRSAATSLPAPPAGLIAESGLIGNANGN